VCLADVDVCTCVCVHVWVCVCWSMYMSHEQCTWVTNCVHETRTDVSNATAAWLCTWVTNNVHESRTMHRIVTNYAHGPRTMYMSHASSYLSSTWYVYGFPCRISHSDLTYVYRYSMDRIVTNYAHEPRTMYMSHALSYLDIQYLAVTWRTYLDMGWLRLVGSIKLQVYFAKEAYKRDAILQKRPML